MKEDRKQVVKSFAEGISIKGIPKAMKAKQWFLKVLWLSAVILGTGLCLVQMIPLLSTYLSYPTTMKMSEAHSETVFPDITVCNLNTHTSDLHTNISYWDYLLLLHDNPDLQERMNVLYEDYDSPEVEISSWLLTKSAYFLYVRDDLLESNLIDKKLFVKDLKYETWLHSQGTMQLEAFQDILQNFTHFVFDPYYGPCYTFKIENKEQRSHTEAFNGIFFLTDEIDSAISEFASKFILDSKISYASGIRVLIHAADSYPDMSRGVNIAPGTEATIWTEMEKRYRLTEPYNTCSKELYLSRNRGSSRLKYTYHDCLSLCFQDEIIQSCNCIAHAQVSTQSQRNTHPFCEVYNEANVNSTYEAMFCVQRKEHIQSDQESKKCNCEVPCEETIYQIRMDSAYWPHEKHHAMFYNTYIGNDPLITNYSLFDTNQFEQIYSDYLYNSDNEHIIDDLRNIDFITRNFVKLTVKFVRSSVIEIVEQPALPFSSLMGTLGGLFNLWIGITFITVIEFVEFFYHLIFARKDSENKVNVMALS